MFDVVWTTARRFKRAITLGQLWAGNSTEARLKADSVLPPISNSLGGSDCANWSPRVIIAHRRAIYSDNIKWLQLFTVWQFYCSHVRPNHSGASGRSSDGVKETDPPLTFPTGRGGVTLQLRRCCPGSASFLVIISDLNLYHELSRMISVLVISLLHHLYFSADCAHLEFIVSLMRSYAGVCNLNYIIFLVLVQK